MLHQFMCFLNELYFTFISHLFFRLDIGSFSSAAKMHLARKQIFPVLVPSRWLTETARDQTVMETVTMSFCSCVAAEKQMQGANLLRRGTHGATTTPMVPLLKGSLYESLAQVK